MEWLLIITMATMGSGGIHTQRLPHVVDCPAVAMQITQRFATSAFCVLAADRPAAWQEWLDEQEYLRRHPDKEG